ncbi:trypsin [Anabrus simplex]|uniref:trypsin n=1 Tax=Anabrus simplex TaxID=316456 RepID=UPI0035A34E04
MYDMNLESEYEYEDRIIAGAYADIKEFPSTVYLVVTLIDPTTNNIAQSSCGGTIISDYWVLTACHCVITSDMVFKEAQLRAGSASKDLGGEVRMAYTHIMHERFDPIVAANDIALLKVSSPFPIDGVEIKIANLATEGQIVPIGTQATIVGWGKTTMEGETSPYLQKAQMKVIGCMQESMICTLANKADVVFGSAGKFCENECYKQTTRWAICSWICKMKGDFLNNMPAMESGYKGDSGGPLFVDDVVVGVFSAVSMESLPKLPNLFSRVSFFRDWIRSNSGV